MLKIDQLSNCDACWKDFDMFTSNGYAGEYLVLCAKCWKTESMNRKAAAK